MHRRLTLAAILALPLAACGDRASSSAAATTALTGLYESGEGPRRNQLCLVERDGGRGSFGLIQWGRGDANCSASGTVLRESGRLRLLPDGEESCAMEASVEGGRIALTGGPSAECVRYYCGPGGELAEAAFEKAGEDPAPARDLAGEPLCGN